MPKKANVRGANVKLALRPLVVAWQQMMLLPNEWISMCEIGTEPFDSVIHTA